MQCLKSIKYLFVFLFLIGCSRKIIGTYVYKSDFVIHKLKIESDSTFTYEIIGDVGLPSVTTGKWTFYSPILNLKSFDSYKVYNVFESYLPNMQSPMIEITDIRQSSTQGDYVTFDLDTIKYFFDKKNKIIVPDDFMNFRSLVIHTMKEVENYSRDDVKSNFFKIVYDSYKISTGWYICDTFIKKGRYLKNDILFLKMQ